MMRSSTGTPMPAVRSRTARLLFAKGGRDLTPPRRTDATHGPMRPSGLGFVRHWRTRARVVAVAAGLALVGHAVCPRPPERSREGLATWLGAQVKGRVQATDLAWEPSRGALGDFLLGRGLWFLATPELEKGRDLFRASVRLLPNGQPLTLSAPANLSATPDADEPESAESDDPGYVPMSEWLDDFDRR